jgi:hypothetical protein
MINILVSHHKIWQAEQTVAAIIYEYLQNQSVKINLNNEGPCADSIGLYKILDYVCEKFAFDKSRITILTCNFEETHPEYTILKKPQHWISRTVETFNQMDFCSQNKDVTKNLFGCVYNVPSWDRLCLLSYIYANTSSPSMLFCNGVWEGSRYNSYYFNELIDFFPEQFFAVVDFLKSSPSSVLQDAVSNKPVTADNLMKVTTLYNDFFIDVVAETFVQGLSFFITEKTIRPMLTTTPFIIQAPKSFLRTLKSDYQVQSFDRWWCEDYDNYEGSTRLEHIFKVIDYVNTWTVGDRQQVYQEMQPILQHNRNIWLTRGLTR